MKRLPSSLLLFSLCLALASALCYAQARTQVSAAASIGQAHQEDLEAQDLRRMEARVYPLGRVARIVVGKAQFRDAQGGSCTQPRITERRVRVFLAQAVPVSQIAVLNYHGVYGECVSDDVLVRFIDGRSVHLAFGADSGVAYLSPVVRGRETDVFFYHCDACTR